MRTKTILAIVLLVPGLASASGYEVIAANPRDLALSSSTVAAQVDAGAAFFNPAALSKLEGPAVSVAGSMLHIWTDWTATGRERAQRERHDGLPSGHAHRRLRGVGHEARRPGPRRRRGRREPVRRKRVLGRRLGGARPHHRGSAALLRHLPHRGVRGHPAAPRRRRPRLLLRHRVPEAGHPAAPRRRLAEIDTKGGALQLRRLRGDPAAPRPPAHDRRRLQAQGAATLEGDAQLRGPAGAQSPATQDQDVEHELTLPNLLTWGVAFRVAKPGLVTLQHSWSRWEVYQSDTVRGGRGAHPHRSRATTGTATSSAAASSGRRRPRWRSGSAR